MTHSRAARWLACAALAWGTFAFGGVYPWVYWPLIVLCAASGLIGLRACGRDTFPRDVRVLAAALGLVGAAVIVQLLPWPLRILARVSPMGARLAEQLDVNVALAAVGAHAVSIDPMATIRALAFYAAFALMALGLTKLSRRDVHRLLWALAWLGTLLAITAIIQKPLYKGAIYGLWTPQTEGGVFGPFVNKNHFAGWMLMAIPLALGYFCATLSDGFASVRPTLQSRLRWLSSPDASKAIQAGFAAVIMSLSLALTISRSGLIALGIAILLCGAAAVRRQRGIGVRVLIPVSLTVVSTAVIIWAGTDAVAARFLAADTAVVGGRIPIWRGGIQMLHDFWLTGSGLNTYGVATLFYPAAVPGRYVGEAHNDYLQLAVEGGLLVGVPIVAALMVFAATVHRRFKAAVGADYWLRLGGLAGLIAIAVQSSVDFSLQIPGNAALFTVVCAILLHRNRQQA